MTALTSRTSSSLACRHLHSGGPRYPKQWLIYATSGQTQACACAWSVEGPDGCGLQDGEKDTDDMGILLMLNSASRTLPDFESPGRRRHG